MSVSCCEHVDDPQGGLRRCHRANLPPLLSNQVMFCVEFTTFDEIPDYCNGASAKARGTNTSSTWTMNCPSLPVATCGSTPAQPALSRQTLADAEVPSTGFAAGRTSCACTSAGVAGPGVGTLHQVVSARAELLGGLVEAGEGGGAQDELYAAFLRDAL